MDFKDIVEGGIYVYVCGLPAGAQGQLYKAHRIILDVPSYQHKVLVEALTGDDKGLWFCCSLDNFQVRYRPADTIMTEGEQRIKLVQSERPPIVEKRAGSPSTGSGV